MIGSKPNLLIDAGMACWQALWQPKQRKTSAYQDLARAGKAVVKVIAASPRAGIIFLAKISAVVLIIPLLLEIPPVNSWAGMLWGRLSGCLWNNGETQTWGKWRQPDYFAINQAFDRIETEFPRELLKAIAWCESRWQHWDESGGIFTGVNYALTPVPDSGYGPWLQRARRVTYDYGIMQINDRDNSLNGRIWNPERIKEDPLYNIQAAIAVLKAKQRYVHYLRHKANWKTIERVYALQNHSELDITLKAYNGFKRSWHYPRRIYTLMKQKPWEKIMLQTLKEQDKYPREGIRLYNEAEFKDAAPGRLVIWEGAEELRKHSPPDTYGFPDHTQTPVMVMPILTTAE